MVRSVGGLGEMGTLSRKSPVGMSSPSSSSHSSSSSNADLRLLDCQLLRLGLGISFGSLGSRCMLGLLLRCGWEMHVAERLPGGRRGDFIYCSGSRPRLPFRTLTSRIWVLMAGRVGRRLGTARTSRLACVPERSLERGNRVVDAALCLRFLKSLGNAGL